MMNATRRRDDSTVRLSPRYQKNLAYRREELEAIDRLQAATGATFAQLVKDGLRRIANEHGVRWTDETAA